MRVDQSDIGQLSDAQLEEMVAALRRPGQVGAGFDRLFEGFAGALGEALRARRMAWALLVTSVINHDGPGRFLGDATEQESPE